LDVLKGKVGCRSPSIYVSGELAITTSGEDLGSLLPTYLERKQISQEELLLLHSGIGIKVLPRYVHILYLGVNDVTVVNSVVTALTTLSISKSI
jgi:hypothetical protein